MPVLFFLLNKHFLRKYKCLLFQLSHYLDLVEVQISRQVSLRSEAFFQAMSSHDKLQENMASTCLTIKELREKINGMAKSTVEGPLHILKLHSTRSNYVKLHNKVSVSRETKSRGWITACAHPPLKLKYVHSPSSQIGIDMVQLLMCMHELFALLIVAKVFCGLPR